MAYIFVIVALYVGICWFLAVGFLRPVRFRSELPSSFESLSILTRGGPLSVWSSPKLLSSQPKCVFVFAHGYGGNREYWAEVMVQMIARQHGCLALPMPGQDDNPDPSVGFGPKEADLIADAVNWLKKQPALRQSKVIVVGVSMGGSAAWLATERTTGIDAVISEGSYARFGPVPDVWLNRKLPYGSIILRPVIWFAHYQLGVNPHEINPVRSAEKFKGISLVVQGSADKLIPEYHAHELAKATKAELWIVPDATHANCREVATREFDRRLLEIADRVVER